MRNHEPTVLHTAFAISTGFVCCLALTVLGQPEAAAPVVEAARQREKAVRTVAVEFRLVEEIAAGGVKDTKTLKVPAKATTLESTNRLVIAGNKTRFERNHPIWNPGTGALKQMRQVSTANGTVNKSLYAIGLTRPEQPEGIIGRNGEANEIKTGILVPLAVWYRGMQNELSPVPLAEYRPTGAVANIGGKECQEYARSGNRGEITYSWFDAGSGYALRRIRTDGNGQPLTQYDIEFRLHELGVWVVASWVRTRFSPDGRVLATEKVEVLSTRLNEEYPESTFDVTFPTGTRVYDARENKFYMVQDEGTLREYSIETGELVPEAVSQPGIPWAERAPFWITIVSALCVVAVALKRRERV
jgi:hypothetical protein